jgi:tetratricopeptide (TPR) repeat protein
MRFSTIAFLCLILVSCKSLKKGRQELSYAQLKKFNDAYFEGTKQKALGNTDEAIKEFYSAYKIDPASHAVMYQLGNLSFKKKDLTEAIYWAEKAVKANPEYNHWYSGQLGQFYNRQGQYAKSADIFEKMMAQDPNRLSNYIEASNQYINAGDFKKGIAVLEKYQAKFGVDEESARKMEQLYIKMGKPEKALEEISKLTELFPDEVRYWGLLAETQMSLGKKKDAEKSYLKIIALDSLNGYAQFGIADILRSRGEADASFEHLLMGFKDERVKLANKLQVISSYYLLLQKDEKSKNQVFKLAEVLMKTHPNESLSYVVYSDLLYATGKYAESRQYLLKALEFETSDFKIWQKLISIDEQLNDMSLLELDSRKALEYFPNLPALYIYNGFALISLKQYEKSIQISEDGLAIAIQQKDKVQLHLNIADAYQQQGKHVESDKAFDEVLKLEPNNALALNNYAYFLALRKVRLDEAEAMVKKAIAEEADNPSYLDTYGWVLFQSGKYAEALEQIKKAGKLDPTNPEILEHAGDALFKLGRTEEARTEWKKALERKGDQDRLNKKISEGLTD